MISTHSNYIFSLRSRIATSPPPPIEQFTAIATASCSHSSDDFDHRNHHRVLFRRRARLLFRRRYSPRANWKRSVWFCFSGLRRRDMC
ncbi:hypothetical protein S83_044415 [Arachis hypogaea]